MKESAKIHLDINSCAWLVVFINTFSVITKNCCSLFPQSAEKSFLCTHLMYFLRLSSYPYSLHRLYIQRESNIVPVKLYVNIFHASYKCSRLFLSY